MRKVHSSPKRQNLARSLRGTIRNPTHKALLVESVNNIMDHVHNVNSAASARLQRLLAPPICRLVAPVSWTLATVLGAMPLLRTHLIAVLVKQKSEVRSQKTDVRLRSKRGSFRLRFATADRSSDCKSEVSLPARRVESLTGVIFT